jgi:hypothetical protein
MAKKVVNTIAAQVVQNKLCRNDSELWQCLRMAKNCLDDLSQAIARAGDASREILKDVSVTEEERAQMLLQEIYAASKDRRPHGGRILRAEQWRKLCAIVGAKP